MGFLIFTEFDKSGKFGSKIRQICQLSLNLGKTQLVINKVQKIECFTVSF